MRKTYTTPAFTTADVVRTTLSCKTSAIVESDPNNTKPSSGTHLSFGL